MTQRRWRLMLMVLGASLAFAAPAEAQRSGFIIGFGLGPGEAFYEESTEFRTSDGQSRTGVATDFHIGGVVGDSFQLYYMSKLIFFGGMAQDFDVTGLTGLGFTIPLNPDFYVNGGVGIHIHWWSQSEGDAVFNDRYSGLGLVAGGGYHLSQRWVVDFDMMYGRPGDAETARSTRVLGAKVSINVLSL